MYLKTSALGFYNWDKLRTMVNATKFKSGKRYQHRCPKYFCDRRVSSKPTKFEKIYNLGRVSLTTTAGVIESNSVSGSLDI